MKLKKLFYWWHIAKKEFGSKVAFKLFVRYIKRYKELPKAKVEDYVLAEKSWSTILGLPVCK